MRLIDKIPKVSRRTLLRTGGVTAAAAAMAPSVVMTGKVWAATPVAVSAGTFSTLVKMARDIYPHDKLSDAAYVKVVEGLDVAAKGDAAAMAMLEDGAKALDMAAAGMKHASYRDMESEDDRVAILTSMESTPFFQKIRGSLVTGIYNNQELWAQFGYEGESASQGGYINRGFNDIDWLDKA